MNKDEMIKERIEQMAIMDCQRVPRGTECADCCFARADCCNFYRMATKLYNENYRKIEDDEIVVKKSEYETLKAQNDTLELYNKDLKYTNTQLSKANKLFEKRNNELLDELQGLTAIKEKTAREILQDLYNHLKCACFPENVSMRWLKATAQKHGIELE